MSLAAIAQARPVLSFIEGCDLIDATLRFHAKNYRAICPVVLLIVYVRRGYKPLRNFVYDLAGLKKRDFNGEQR
jgi:hypothetical protein